MFVTKTNDGTFSVYSEFEYHGEGLWGLDINDLYSLKASIESAIINEELKDGSQ